MKKPAKKSTPTKSLWPQTFAICAAIIFASASQIDVVVEPDYNVQHLIIMFFVILVFSIAAIWGSD